MIAQLQYRLLLPVAIGLALLPAGCGAEGARNVRIAEPSNHEPAGAPAVVGETPGPTVETSVIGLTTAEHFALLEEDIVRLETAAKDAASFGPNRKMLRTEALALAVYAQVGINEGDKGLTKKLALVRNGAFGFAAAAEAGNREEAVRAGALAKGFRVATGESQPRSVSIPLNRIIPLTNLMEQAGLLTATMSEYEAISLGDWGQPTKRDEILHNTWRMAALVRAMREHTPETDPNPKKGQTRQLWQETLRDCRTEVDVLLSAVRSNNPTTYAAGYKALDAACNRCHIAYRVE
jgi:hypothetical protein